jgi:hypothetical protein
MVAFVAVFAAVAVASPRVVLCTTGDGTHCYGWASHPTRIEVGADGRLQFLKLKWTWWGRGTATATGVRRDDAGPAGHPQYIYHRISMTANRIGNCGRHRAYTRLVIRGHGLPRMTLNACRLG